jgi:hypothetical protein
MPAVRRLPARRALLIALDWSTQVARAPCGRRLGRRLDELRSFAEEQDRKVDLDGLPYHRRRASGRAGREDVHGQKGFRMDAASVDANAAARQRAPIGKSATACDFARYGTLKSALSTPRAMASAVVTLSSTWAFGNRLR